MASLFQITKLKGGYLLYSTVGEWLRDECNHLYGINKHKQQTHAAMPELT
jgi:hypothetical protein